MFIKTRKSWLQSLSSVCLSLTFLLTSILPPAYARVLNLPQVGAMVGLSPTYTPAIVAGITVYPEDPFLFNFIIHPGDDNLQGDELTDEAQKLIKYFLAALTVSEDEMWVNLSPYEKNRIIPSAFGDTEMGRDLLAQDYMLKQLTASLMYPEDKMGSEFWQRVYQRAQEEYGTTDIPMNTFNKVWIVPDKASVYVNDNNVFVVDSHMKVMLEEDYLALDMNVGSMKHGVGQVDNESQVMTSEISAELIREIIIPELEREVNEGQTFANLRQITHSVILATWYKENVQGSLLENVYINQNKTEGIDTQDKEVNQKIYNQYVEAFKKGVYDFIKEDYDASTGQVVLRKYFSGGVNANLSGKVGVSSSPNPIDDAISFKVQMVDPYEGSGSPSTIDPEVEWLIQKGYDNGVSYVQKGFSRIVKKYPFFFKEREGGGYDFSYKYTDGYYEKIEEIENSDFPEDFGEIAFKISVDMPLESISSDKQVKYLLKMIGLRLLFSFPLKLSNLKLFKFLSADGLLLKLSNLKLFKSSLDVVVVFQNEQLKDVYVQASNDEDEYLRIDRQIKNPKILALKKYYSSRSIDELRNVIKKKLPFFEDGEVPLLKTIALRVFRTIGFDQQKTTRIFQSGDKILSHFFVNHKSQIPVLSSDIVSLPLEEDWNKDAMGFFRPYTGLIFEKWFNIGEVDDLADDIKLIVHEQAHKIFDQRWFKISKKRREEIIFDLKQRHEEFFENITQTDDYVFLNSDYEKVSELLAFFMEVVASGENRLQMKNEKTDELIIDEPITEADIALLKSREFKLLPPDFESILENNSVAHQKERPTYQQEKGLSSSPVNEPFDEEFALDGKRGPVVTVENPLNDQASSPGGIDLNPNNIDIKTQGQKINMQVPSNIDIDQWNNTNGFVPVILKISPITNIPLLLGFDTKSPDEQLSSTKYDDFYDERCPDFPLSESTHGCVKSNLEVLRRRGNVLKVASFR